MLEEEPESSPVATTQNQDLVVTEAVPLVTLPPIDISDGEEQGLSEAEQVEGVEGVQAEQVDEVPASSPLNLDDEVDPAMPSTSNVPSPTSSPVEANPSGIGYIFQEDQRG